MKKQELVLNEIFLSGKELSIKEISRRTGLRTWRVHNAVRHLINRGLIKKRRILNEFVGYCNPPVKEILLRLDDDTPFKYWRVTNIIKNARARGYAYS